MKLFFVIVAMFANIGIARAQAVKELIKPIIEKFESQHKTTGTLLVKKGEDFYAHGMGKANEDTKSLNSANTVFLIASISKQITASAILRLKDQGILSLNTPVSELFPEFKTDNWKKSGESATVHHLLNHTAGAPDAYDKPSIKSRLFKEELSINDFISSIKDSPIEFIPGSKYEYSNTGYMLLGEIVRRISKKTSFSDFIVEEFLKPNHLTETTVGRPSDFSKIALPYDENERGEKVNLIKHHRIKVRHDGDIYTEGNIYSTVKDLTTWAEKLISGKILSTESTMQMLTPGLENYGYGWVIQKLRDGSREIFHGGGWLGYSSILIHYPEKKITLCWFRNYGDGEENEELVNEILGVVLKSK